MARSMPKDFKLSWQPGSGGRKGRWKKVYRGKAYTFPSGRGKSDRDAYDAALAAWEKKKVELDATAPKPHQAEYEKVIREWEEVGMWCREHGDPEMEETAGSKLADLRKRLAQPKPPKIMPGDAFDGQFRPEVVDPAGMTRLKEAYAAMETDTAARWAREMPVNPDLSQFDVEFVRPFTVSGVLAKDDLHLRPLHKEHEIWRDRLDVMQRNATPADDSIAAYVDRFLAQKKDDSAAGEVTPTRVYTLRIQLTHFKDWLGGGVSVQKIASSTLVEYRTALLREVSKGAWSTTTASNRMSTVKSFVRWLWQIEAIESLPRVLDALSLNIAKSSPPVITYTKDEISTLIGAAIDRTRLYILLMLNCGMTQKDIADLQHSEVDWKQGRITRKRSKTKKHRNVPVVSYQLWSETLALLKQERSPGGKGRVLLNRNGSPLVFDDVDKEGKPIKCDNIRNAFNRVCKKTGMAKHLKALKKTSATLLRGHRHYASLYDLFLGHAPTSMADKHYTLPPQDLLDEALGWLHDKLEIAKALKAE